MANLLDSRLRGNDGARREFITFILQGINIAKSLFLVKEY